MVKIPTIFSRENSRKVNVGTTLVVVSQYNGYRVVVNVTFTAFD